jgi:hypothetical protein
MPRGGYPIILRLRKQQVAVMISDDGRSLNVFGLRVQNQDGSLRELTREEELGFGAEPASRIEVEAAESRVGHPDGLTILLVPMDAVTDAELQQIETQMARDSARAKKRH